MKKYLLGILLLVALPLAAETMTQCIINCPPGVNACSNCCMAQFEANKGPCYNGCQAAQKPCFDQAWQSCQGNPSPQYCYTVASNPCQQAVFSCQRACDGSVQVPGGCPGEVPPQKCPYDCQMWNPASQSCIGPTMNGCPPMQATLASTIGELHAMRATADAEKATVHAADLQVKSKAKGKKKKK
jgi:hypothetical protein